MRRWILATAALLLSPPLQAEPTWSVVKEGIPAVGSSGYIALSYYSNEGENISSIFYGGYHWAAWRRNYASWPTWLRVDENEEILDIPAKGIQAEINESPVFGILGGKLRLFYQEKSTKIATMATLDPKSGEALEVSPFDGVPSAVVNGKDKSLVLWRDEEWGSDLLGSFFDESTNQWGKKISFGKNNWNLEITPVLAAFDGKRFLIVRETEYPHTLEVFWLDPFKEEIEDSRKIEPKYNTINRALACMNVEDCIFTFTAFKESGPVPFLAMRISSPGNFTTPEPIYSTDLFFQYSFPRSDLIVDGETYLFSSFLVDPQSPWPRFRVDRLDQAGKHKETVLGTTCFHNSLSFSPNNTYFFCGKEDLRGKKVDITKKEQEPTFSKVIDLDFPSTTPLSTRFWGGDFWGSFSLQRTNSENLSKIDEVWINRINTQGEIIISHQVPGGLRATGKTRALLSSGSSFYLMNLEGYFQKVAEITENKYNKFLFDGVRFVGFSGHEKMLSLLYIEEDGKTETRNIPLLGSGESTYPKEIRSAACGNDSCIFIFSIDDPSKQKIVEIPFHKNPLIWPGTFQDIEPKISKFSELSFNGEDFFSLSHVPPHSQWFIRLNKENLGKSIVVSKISSEDQIVESSRLFTYKNRFTIGMKNKILHFDGNQVSTIDYIQSPFSSKNIFNVSQDQNHLIQSYSIISPQAPALKGFSTLWSRQEDPPENSGGGGQSVGGAAGESSTGGTENQGGTPPTQGGIGGQGQAGGPLGVGGNAAGNPGEEGPPQALPFPSEERGSCGCRWGSTPPSPPFLASLLAALSLGKWRRRKALR